MMEVELGSYVLTVDLETYNKLQDSKFAAEYLNSIEMSGKEQSISMSAAQQTVWTTSKKQTEADFQATYTFLSLRKSFSDQFDEKKTSKNNLWLQIATKMNEMGFFVGHSVLGREKCRQKFMNLQHTYTKYKYQIRQTGEGFVKKPPFFDELDDILGDKHKSNPVIVIDSSRPLTSGYREGVGDPKLVINTDSEENTSKSKIANPSQASEATKKNKFQSIRKSVRPKKTILSTVENIIREERTLRAQQFSSLLEALQDQNKQRHEQTMGIIEVLKKQTRLIFLKFN